jgi:hypothetical protein
MVFVRSHRGVVFAALAMLLVVAPPASADKCSGAKIKAAGKKASCLLGLEAKEAATGTAPDPAKVQKCIAKFTSAFAKAEARPPCNTTGDVAVIEAKVDAFVADVDTELSVGIPNSCQSAKLRAAGKGTKCLLGLEAKEAAKGTAVDPLKVEKCIAKFTSAFEKAEARPPCSTTFDAPTIEAKVDAFVADVDVEVAGLPTTTTLLGGTTTTTTLGCVGCDATISACPGSSNTCPASQALLDAVNSCVAGLSECPPCNPADPCSCVSVVPDPPCDCALTPSCSPICLDPCVVSASSTCMSQVAACLSD